MTVFYQDLSQSSCDKYLSVLAVMDPAGYPGKDGWASPLGLQDVLHI